MVGRNTSKKWASEYFVCIIEYKDYSNPLHITTMHYSQSLPKASVQGHRHPCPCNGLHLDHWAVCSGRGGKGLCLSLCFCQCVSGKEALVEHGYTKLCYIYISIAFQIPAQSLLL